MRKRNQNQIQSELITVRMHATQVKRKKEKELKREKRRKEAQR